MMSWNWNPLAWFWTAADATVKATVKAVVQTAVGVSHAMAGVIAGGWASDHRAESEHFTGWSYIAIHALAMQAAQAEVTAFVDDDPAVGKSRRKSLRTTWGSLAKWRQFRETISPPGSSAAKSTYGADDRATTPLPPTHRLMRLLSRPNKWESGSTFRYKQVQQIRLTGTCLVWNVPGRDGLTTERYVIPTAVATAVNPSSDLPLGGYRISPAISRYAPLVDNGFVEMPTIYRVFGKVIDARQMQVIRLPHPYLLDDGQSPMAAGSLWIDGADQVDKARFSQLHNGANPSLLWVIGDKSASDQPAVDRVAVQVNKKYAGPENTAKIMVAQPGTTVTKLSTSPHEMGYKDGFDQSKAACLSLHNTPPVAVGLQEPGAFAAYYASMRAYRDIAVQPLLDMIAESETETLATQFGEGITIEAEAMTSEDAELAERQLANDLAARTITRDEWRARRGLPPVGPERGGNDWVGAEDVYSFDAQSIPSAPVASTPVATLADEPAGEFPATKPGALAAAKSAYEAECKAMGLPVLTRRINGQHFTEAV